MYDFLPYVWHLLISYILLNHPNNKKYIKLQFYLFFMGAYGCDTWPPPPREQHKWTVQKHTALTVQFDQDGNKWQEWEKYIVRSFIHYLCFSWDIVVSNWITTTKTDEQDTKYRWNRCEMQLWRDGTVWEMQVQIKGQYYKWPQRKQGVRDSTGVEFNNFPTRCDCIQFITLL